MVGHLYPKTIRGTTYYYYQRTWREKINPRDHGKARGSGKSRVRTQSIYLGTAESIFRQLKSGRSPLEIRHREFGFAAAIYQTAVEIGLVSLLRQHIPGERFGLPRWLYFLLPIINRLQHATSKRRMGEWAQTTILPDLLGFDPQRLTSKTFWYAADDVISERELRERRRKEPDAADDLFAGLDDSTFRTIEEELLQNLPSHYDLSQEIFFYDTTNFFTYIEEPVRALLPQTGHNKDCHHHCKQVGLALCVEKEWGIPLFHRLYRGNAHDSQTFAGVVEELLAQLRAGFRQIEKLVLVLDKGNNSPENFAALQGKLHWVGSLVPSHFPDLLQLPLGNYTGEAEAVRYYRCRRAVFGVDCVLVLTYNSQLAKKQEHSLQNGIEKLKRRIMEKWESYKRKPPRVPAGIVRLMEESRYGKYLAATYRKGKLAISETEAAAGQRQRFGKNLLFCSNPEAESAWIITQYRSKDRIEQDFKLLKNPELIRWRPARHWTDTKIRASGFCCVMALLLIQVMLQKVERAGLRMSAAVLKEELTDLREIVMVYEDQSAEMKISRRSSVQRKLWNLFDLGSIEQRLPYT
ncbi:MAG: IS1634 family transposase [Candidatus Omnitrophota bacterium]